MNRTCQLLAPGYYLLAILYERPLASSQKLAARSAFHP